MVALVKLASKAHVQKSWHLKAHNNLMKAHSFCYYIPGVTFHKLQKYFSSPSCKAQGIVGVLPYWSTVVDDQTTVLASRSSSLQSHNSLRNTYTTAWHSSLRMNLFTWDTYNQNSVLNRAWHCHDLDTVGKTILIWDPCCLALSCSSKNRHHLLYMIKSIRAVV